jgi:hypothetical protein
MSSAPKSNQTLQEIGCSSFNVHPGVCAATAAAACVPLSSLDVNKRRNLSFVVTQKVDMLHSVACWAKTGNSRTCLAMQAHNIARVYSAHFNATRTDAITKLQQPSLKTHLDNS